MGESWANCSTPTRPQDIRIGFTSNARSVNLTYVIVMAVRQGHHISHTATIVQGSSTIAIEWHSFNELTQTGNVHIFGGSASTPGVHYEDRIRRGYELDIDIWVFRKDIISFYDEKRRRGKSVCTKCTCSLSS